MKKRILSAIIIMATLFATAQDNISWSLKHDKKELLKANKEDPEKNVIVVKPADFKNKGNFIISCSETNKRNSRKNWVRTIGIFTEHDTELYRKDSGYIKITDMQLKKMLQENRIVKIYTWATPADPAEAARVRIRRVHLCTIEYR